jgi:hypothetical protein
VTRESLERVERELNAERLVSLRRAAGEATVNMTGPGDHAQLGPFRGIRVECHECQGVGYVLKSVNDLLRESLGLLGDAGDAVVTEFYRRLIDADNGKDPADQLASLFPPDLLTDDRTRGQRDKLLKALTALADLVSSRTIRRDGAAGYGVAGVRAQSCPVRASGRVRCGGRRCRSTRRCSRC